MSFDLFYARLPFVVQHYYHIHTIGTLVRTVVPCGGGTTTTYNFCSLCFLCCILTYYFYFLDTHFYKKKTFFCLISFVWLATANEKVHEISHHLLLDKKKSTQNFVCLPPQNLSGTS